MEPDLLDHHPLDVLVAVSSDSVVGTDADAVAGDAAAPALAVCADEHQSTETGLKRSKLPVRLHAAFRTDFVKWR